MLYSSIGEAVGKSKTIVRKLDDDVAEYQVQENYFAGLQCQHAVEIQCLTSLWTWDIRVEDYIIEKTNILMDHEREETARDDEEEAPTKIKKSVK